MSRFRADAPYLAAISECYHALRPLRVVVDSASQPFVEYLQQLASSVACQIIPSRVARHDLPEQVRAASAHFAVCIDGDGETCQVFDEHGREVSAEQLLLLLAQVYHIDESLTDCRRRLQTPMAAMQECKSATGVASYNSYSPLVPTLRMETYCPQRSALVDLNVVEKGTSKRLSLGLNDFGMSVTVSCALRADMAAAMRAANAILGGGPSGRFWHSIAGIHLPDALMTVTRLLVLLSHGDEPFSAVLDHEASAR